MSGSAHGSAVLVHGLWGNPEDWFWVRGLLEDRGVLVDTPDVPSHQSAASGLDEDAEAVRRAIHSSPRPVVVAGTSYGCTVMSVAAAGEGSVAHLIYVADVPRLGESERADSSWADEDPHIHALDGGMFVLDDDWWMNEEAGTTMSNEVRAHLHRHRRRPASWAVFDPQKETAWESVPVTVLIGLEDDLLDDEDRSWAVDHFDDVRQLPTDHFVIMRDPDVVAEAVFEALDRAR